MPESSLFLQTFVKIGPEKDEIVKSWHPDGRKYDRRSDKLSWAKMLKQDEYLSNARKYATINNSNYFKRGQLWNFLIGHHMIETTLH